MIDIDISDALRHPGREYDYAFEGGPEFEGVRLGGPLTVHAQYALESDALRVKGKIRTWIEASCSRCLKDMQFEVDERFNEVFVERAGDQDTYTFSREAKRVSLDQMVRDMLLTVLPMQLLCSEDCKGLCPKCGANLNEGPCGCGDGGDARNMDENNPFAKLKDLF